MDYVDTLLYQWFSPYESNCFIQTPVETKVVGNLRLAFGVDMNLPFKGVFFTHQKSTLQFGVSSEHTNSKVEKPREGQ